MTGLSGEGAEALRCGAPPSAFLARRVLVAFLLTFLTARVLVLLIMSRRLPDLYLHLGGTHVHHLNYGIFLLCAVAGYLLFGRPNGRPLTAAALAYGIGLALTFDEFGMWIHLGGSYWQRASFDAVIVVAAALATVAAAPAWRSVRPRSLATAALIAAAVGLFGALLVESLRHGEARFGPPLEDLERRGPR